MKEGKATFGAASVFAGFIILTQHIAKACFSPGRPTRAKPHVSGCFSSTNIFY